MHDGGMALSLIGSSPRCCQSRRYPPRSFLLRPANSFVGPSFDPEGAFPLSCVYFCVRASRRDNLD